MKKVLFLCAVLALLVACEQGNTPAEVQEVTFSISNFSQSTDAMGMPRKAPILDDTDGQALTDIYVFDGSTLLCHQTSDQADFGTFTLSLTHGTHQLSVLATRSSGIAVSGSTMTMDNVRSTFGVLHSVTVSGNTPAQELTLVRISGSMVITITDEFPSNANEIEFVIDPRYKQLDVTTLCATNGASVTQRVSCASKVGKVNQSYTFTLLAPSLTEEYTADVTINVYNDGGVLIHSVSIADVRLASNTKTLLSGKVFRGTDATLNIDHTWNQDIEGSF